MKFFDPRGENKIKRLSRDVSQAPIGEYWEEMIEILLTLIYLNSNSQVPKLVPTENEIFNLRIKSISSVKSHSAMVVLSDESGKSMGRAYTWGDNSVGQLGNCNLKPIKIPTVVPLLRISHVACGNQFTIFVQDSYTIFACGKNENGTFQLEKFNNSSRRFFNFQLEKIHFYQVNWEQETSRTESFHKSSTLEI